MNAGDAHFYTCPKCLLSSRAGARLRHSILAAYDWRELAAQEVRQLGGGVAARLVLEVDTYASGWPRLS